MNKALKQELDRALEGFAGTTRFLTDDQVREVIAGLRGIAARITKWNQTRRPHR